MSRLQVGENVIYPSIRVIEQILEEFIAKEGNQVIFIERLDYLITQRGFEKTLQFIQQLSSLMYVTQSIAVLHIDPLTISERELVLIEKETKGLKEPFMALEEDLHEMLSYIHEKNSHGIKPNLKQVTRELDLSRNTARKRIQSLQLKGFVILREKGREKVLEITRRGEENI
jgi:predicted transcriptional regulator